MPLIWGMSVHRQVCQCAKIQPGMDAAWCGGHALWSPCVVLRQGHSRVILVGLQLPATKEELEFQSQALE